MIIYDFNFLDFPSPDNGAVSVFMTGCVHNCPECQNPDLQKYVKNNQTNEEILNNIKLCCKRNDTDKIVLTGGDCLFPKNLKLTNFLLNNLKDYQTCLYTGYNIDYVKSVLKPNTFTYVKCGKFIKELYQESEKTDEYMKFASTNQELYDSNFNLLSINGIYKFNKD